MLAVQMFIIQFSYVNMHNLCQKERVEGVILLRSFEIWWVKLLSSGERTGHGMNMYRNIGFYTILGQGKKHEACCKHNISVSKVYKISFNRQSVSYSLLW